MDVDPQLVELGVRLAESSVRNTASSIATRVQTAKAAKKDREALVELEEIITDLSEDRNELLRIAQAYKEQVASQTVSEQDVQYITSQLVPKLQELFELSGQQDENLDDVVNAVKALLSVETLTILQLLGFNFKVAIGEPLTDLVARSIRSRIVADQQMALEIQRLNTEREIAFIELARDPEALDRFRSLFGTQ